MPLNERMTLMDPESRENKENWDIHHPPMEMYETNEGEPVTIEVILCHGEHRRPPKVSWIKGKWNQLTHGDRFHIESDDKNIWHKMTFQKPLMNDSGSYTLKVNSKSKEEAVVFNLKCHAANKKGRDIKVGKGKTGRKKKTEEVIDFKSMLKKTSRAKKEDDKGCLWGKLKGATPKDKKDLAFQFGFSLRHIDRRLKKLEDRDAGPKCDKFKRQLQAFAHYKHHDKIELECVVKDTSVPCEWHFNGKPIEAGPGIEFVEDGKIRKLIIDQAVKDLHDGTISCMQDGEGTEWFHKNDSLIA